MGVGGGGEDRIDNPTHGPRSRGTQGCWEGPHGLDEAPGRGASCMDSWVHCPALQRGAGRRGGCLPPGDRGTRLLHPLLLGLQNRAEGGRGLGTGVPTRSMGDPGAQMAQRVGAQSRKPLAFPGSSQSARFPASQCRGTADYEDRSGIPDGHNGETAPSPNNTPSETPSSSSPASFAPPTARSPPPRSPRAAPPPSPALAAHRMPPPPGRPHRSVLRGIGVPAPAQRSVPLFPTRSRSTTAAAPCPPPSPRQHSPPRAPGPGAVPRAGRRGTARSCCPAAPPHRPQPSRSLRPPGPPPTPPTPAPHPPPPAPI